MNLLDMAPKVALQLAMPAKTASYQPVGNEDLLGTIQQNIDNRGLIIEKVDMRVAAHGQQFMGTIQLKSPQINDQDLGMSFGFRNSYNKSFPVGFGAGAEVFVCSNGMFLADVKAVRKHTTLVWQDIDNILNQQMNHLSSNFDGLVTDMKELKTTFLSQRDVQEIVWNLWAEEKVLTSPQMNILKKEMFNSENFKMYDSKDKFDGSAKSAWYMYNNLTESLKVSHPSSYFKNHEKVHQLMMTYCN